MALTFTPDLLSYSNLSRNVADLKARADITRTEAVTGRYEDITAQTNGDIGSAHLTKKALDDVTAYKQNLTFSQNQAASAQTTHCDGSARRRRTRRQRRRAHNG